MKATLIFENWMYQQKHKVKNITDNANLNRSHRCQHLKEATK